MAPDPTTEEENSAPALSPMVTIANPGAVRTPSYTVTIDEDGSLSIDGWSFTDALKAIRPAVAR